MQRQMRHEMQTKQNFITNLWLQVWVFKPSRPDPTHPTHAWSCNSEWVWFAPNA